MKYFLPFLLLALLYLVSTNGLLAQQKTITEVAAEATDFKTLSRTIKVAGLVESLNGNGPFTVFAPTDKAFASLPDGLLDALLRPENEKSLRKILTHHVVNDRLKGADLIRDLKASNGSLSAKSLEGSRLIFSEFEDDLFVQDGRGRKAKIKSTDLKASNGMIHVIDRVLLPASINVAKLLTSEPEMSKVTAAPPPPPPAPAIFTTPPAAKPAPVEEAVATEAIPPPPPPVPAGSLGHLAISDLNSLVSVLQSTELLSTFSSGGQFTTFAPVNAAFEKLPAGSLDDLHLPERDAQMSNTLRYHLIMAPISATALTKALEKGNGFYQMSSMNGQTIIATLKNGKIQLMDGYGNVANIIQTDVPAGKGVMHLIDGVLLPR